MHAQPTAAVHSGFLHNMKFALASDLHLHFGPVYPVPEPGVDLCILAGDIYEISDLPSGDTNYVYKTFEHFNNSFKKVIWIPGNHECYEDDITKVIAKGQAWLKKHKFDNIEFVNRETIEYQDVLFHCATLWVDFENGNEMTKLAVQNCMHDFMAIRYDGYRIVPETLLREHKKDLAFIESALVKDRKNVVITHHAPCQLSLGDQHPYTVLSHGWFSELSEFIFDHQEITAWVHGHLHQPKYYTIDNTVVFSNPRGYYRHEQGAFTWTLQYLEV